MDLDPAAIREHQPDRLVARRGHQHREGVAFRHQEAHRAPAEEAPVSLVFCVDTHRMNRWSALQGGAPHFTGIGVLWVALRGV